MIQTHLLKQARFHRNLEEYNSRVQDDWRMKAELPPKKGLQGPYGPVDFDPSLEVSMLMTEREELKRLAWEPKVDPPPTVLSQQCAQERRKSPRGGFGLTIDMPKRSKKQWQWLRDRFS